MPTYGYECTKCKEQFEVFQRITEAPLASHEGCGGELRRLLYPVGIVFKGPGFYVNDYARAGKKDADKSADAKTETKAEAKPESKTETKTEAKAETKSETKSETAAAKTE